MQVKKIIKVKLNMSKNNIQISWVLPNVWGNKKEKLLHNNQGQRSNKSICGGSSITELVSKLYDFSFENNAL